MRILFSLLTVITQLRAVNFKSEPLLFSWGHPHTVVGTFLVDGKTIFRFDGWDASKNPILTDISELASFKINHGFSEFYYKGKKGYLIPGDTVSEVISAEYVDGKPMDQQIYGVSTEYGEGYPPGDTNVDSISTKTAFSEKIFGRKFIYGPSLLMRKFYIACSCHKRAFENDIPPWIENMPDFGSSEEIVVKFINPTNGMTVLNGHVDVKRPHLFRKRNRLKDILVSAKEFELRFTFVDEIRFTAIKFPAKTDSVKIRILSVYSGDKSDQTAIGTIMGIIPAEPEYYRNIREFRNSKQSESTQR